MIAEPEQNKKRIKQFIDEVLNARAFDRLEEFLAADYMDHSEGLAGRDAIEGLRRGFEKWLESFPDHHIRIAQILAEGDLVAVRSVSSATHRGSYLGLPGTDTSVTFEAHELFRLHENKVVEHWEIWDEAGLLRQLKLDRASSKG
jgi:steroid delta-isomerase-like uncharacterized protein